MRAFLFRGGLANAALAAGGGGGTIIKAALRVDVSIAPRHLERAVRLAHLER